jgi:hypothetical protein
MKKETLFRLGISAILFFLLIIALNVTAQVRVTRITGPGDADGKNGVVYNLPRTLVHVDLLIARNQQFAGPLAEYAVEYMGIDNATLKDQVTYAIAGAEIRPVCEPDPNQAYIIEKEEKSQSEIWISFGAHSPVIALEKFEKTAAPGGFVKWHDDLFIKPEHAALFRKYTDSPTRESIDTVTRRVSIDTLVFEEQIFRSSMVEFTDVEKAQEAAARIRQIEHDQYNLLIGYQETAYARETLEFMLERLEAQRLEYLKLFTGVNVTETLAFDFVIIPDNENEAGEYVIAGFSKSAGIIPPEGQNIITLNVKKDNPGINLSSVKDGQMATGLVYRVPQPVTAVVSFQGKELVSKRIDVLQLSPLLSLPSTFKRVEFDRNTGELRSVVLE